MPKFSILVLSYDIPQYAYMIEKCEAGMREFCEKDTRRHISFSNKDAKSLDGFHIEGGASNAVFSVHLPYEQEDCKRRSVFVQVFNEVNKSKCFSAVILLGDILAADFKWMGSPIKEIPVLFTLCNTPHELEKNQYHLWAPLISIVARKAAITAISDSCCKALIIRNKSDENDVYSRVSHGVFTKYFEYLGGEIVGDQSFDEIVSDGDFVKDVDCAYITGFGGDYHRALKCVLDSAIKKIYTDQAFLDEHEDRQQRFKELSDNPARIHCFDYQINQSTVDFSDDDSKIGDVKFSLFCKVALKFLYSAYKFGDLKDLISHPDFSSYVTIDGNGFLISKTGRMLSSIGQVQKIGGNIAPINLSKGDNETSFLLTETNQAVKRLISRKFCVIEESIVEEVLTTVCRQIARTIRPNIQLWELGNNRTFGFSVEDGLVKGRISLGDVKFKGLFDLAVLVSKAKVNCVQINISEDDSEDNDVFRLYVSVKGKLFSINHYLFKKDTPKNVEFLTLTSRLVDDCVESNFESDLRLKSDGTYKISEILKSLKLVAQKKELKYVYIFLRGTPHSANRYALLVTEQRLSYSEINVLQNVVNRVLEPIQLSDNLNHFARKALESAIGSIMSRNGSHNIGSHVLAALSHNVGTMPDDRVLYQYIQQRMDYIATATTEFPTWRQPTMLVSDMMRTFLSQTHLLNYISRSDGLRAYQFQNPTVDKDSQHEVIRLHIRRIRSGCKNWERVSLVGAKDKVDSFIEYGNGGEASLDKDIAVAIPGGVVGQQAFFTIMENIIRNAAKHEWSKVMQKTESNLDVYVDFHDNQREGIVEMRIWTDCKGLKAEGVQRIIADLKGKIEQSFISPDSGALVRENWGLSEMRIATGFLRDSGIEKIGGIGEEEGRSCDLVWPIGVEHDNKICLGYRFDLLKPKELLIIVPDGRYRNGANGKSESDIEAINRALGQFGIELMRKGKVNELSKGLPYSYIVVEDIDFVKDERLLTRMPFRMLSRKPAKNPRNKCCNVIAKYVGTFYDLEKNDTIDNKLRKLRELFQAPDEAKKFAHNLLEDVYASWVNHIRNERGISSDSKLVIDVDGDGKGAAKSLVTDSDLLHFVFEHSFNSAVRGYLKTVDKMQIRPELVGALYSFAMLDCKKIMSVEDLSECKNSEGQELDVVCKIALQLIRFAEICLSKLTNSDERTGVEIDVEKTDMDGNAYVDERWTQSLRHLNLLKCLFYIYEGCKAIYNEDNGDGVAGYFDVRAFIWHFRDVILEQARSFLSKYEERITTIPETFVSAKAIADKTDSQYGTTQPGGTTIVPVDEWRLHEMEGMPVLSAVFSANRLDIMKQGFHRNGFCYWRHGDEDGKVKDDFLKEVKYFEPLSGSQSYLNSLISLRNNVRNGKCLQRHVSDNRLSAIRAMTGLVESALMRILIIDERASKFEREHPEVARIFETACIKVLDDKSEDVLQLVPPVSKFDLVEKFEIVIIHQGILDKILPDHSEQGVDAFLQKLKEHLRYVVITTGRGMPSNIPATARVLPFSVVESAMFARHPEKMLLVDTVMNILPGEKR